MIGPLDHPAATGVLGNAEYVIACNVTRRNMSTGARAMATALVLLADGRRENGRWRRGSVRVGNGDSSITSAWIKSLNNCGIVLDFKPDLAPDVVAGTLALNAAFEQADAIRTSAERDKILARERRKREKAEAAAEAEFNAQIVAGHQHEPSRRHTHHQRPGPARSAASTAAGERRAQRAALTS